MGGTELNAVRTIEALDSRKFEVFVACLRVDGPLRQRYESRGIPIAHFPIGSLYTKRTISQGIKLAKHVRTLEIDIVHTHDVYTNVFCVPYVRALTAAKIIASRRWWYDVPRAGLNILNRLSYTAAHRVLANSSAVAALLRTNERVSDSKIVEIPNFLEERAFEPISAGAKLDQRRRWGIPRDGFLIGCVARLSPVKNHQLLLEALARLPSDYHLVLVGDGPERLRLRELCETLVLEDRVHFAGEISGSANLHGYFDVSVLASRSEGFPNTVLEAMASGTPVVSTAVGGVPEVLGQGLGGLLVPSGNASALANAIGTIRDDRSGATDRTTWARATALTRYHLSNVMPSLESLYLSLSNITAQPCLRDTTAGRSH